MVLQQRNLEMRQSSLRRRTAKSSNRERKIGILSMLQATLVVLFILREAFWLVMVMRQPHEDAASTLPWVSPITDLSCLLRSRVAANNTNTTDNNKPYAYMWVIGGIRVDQPTYKGFFYDVLISVHLLKERLNSTDADFWLLAQMSPDSPSDALPPDDLCLLHELGIKLRMLAKPEAESFAQVVYEKFRALELTQYRRVIFLDADTIPLVNLDYIFHLSDPLHASTPTVLRPNLIMASRSEPCNTGFFMVEPKEGRWELIQSIIRETRERGKNLPYPHFCTYEGWGHNFWIAKDYWESIHEKNGKVWSFHAGHSDQGLMYYYTRYAVRDVSIAIGETVKNLYTAPGSLPKDVSHKVVETLPKGLEPYFPEPIEYEFDCHGEYPDTAFAFKCSPIFQGFAHFMGKDKPWQRGGRAPDFTDNRKPRQTATNRLWFDTLNVLNAKFGMGLDIPNWVTTHRDFMQDSPLGYIASYTDNAGHLLNGTSHHDGIFVGLSEFVEDTLDPSISLRNVSIVPNRHAVTIDGEEIPLKYYNTKFVDRRASIRPPPGEVFLKREDAPSTIAYAISFVKCGDWQTHSAGLTDASLILRHSIHKVSKRTPESGSHYDYKMYAIVHRNAEQCTQVLTDAGFAVMVVDPPVQREEIRGDELRRKIVREVCCGHDEFIKLYAYTIPEEIIVHVDIDSAFFKPMDDLFDAMLFDKDSDIGRAARQRLLLERPDDPLPDKIGAFLTRDWAQVAPKKFPPGYQAGFLVARRDPTVLAEMVDVVKEGNFTSGWGVGFGWSGTGHGGYIGAMAMQGLVGYYYDFVRLNNAVELNQCRFNHMGLDSLYRKHGPNFSWKYGGVGGCRSARDDCEQCLDTDFEKIYSAHYTMCRKPWQCQAEGFPGGKKPDGERASAINIDAVHLDHCMALVSAWHSLRADFEDQLYALTSDETIKNGTVGNYKPEIFRGHCNGDGNDHYVAIQGNKESFSRVLEIYN